MKIVITLSLIWMSLTLAAFAETEVFKAGAHPFKGQVLVVHGLNLKPQKMSDVISIFNLQGYDVLLLKLSGHTGDLETMRNVTCLDWENQVAEAFKEIQTMNAVKGGKILLAGFSIGALLPIEYLIRHPEVKIHQAILFAPALSLKMTSYLVNVFKIFGDRFIVPSFSKVEYRAQEGTSMGAYRCLFKGVKDFERSDLKAIPFPMLVFMSPDDELVSFESIKKLSGKIRMKLITINTTRASHHLIIDKNSVGEIEWNTKVFREISNFLVE